MSRNQIRLIGTAIFSTIVAAAAHGGEIVTDGTAVVKQLPGTLRARITIHERRTGIREANSRLSDDRRALHDYLLALGAIPRSISFGEVSVTGRGKGKSDSAPAKRFRGFSSTISSEDDDTVSLTVEGTAEWELSARSQQELVVEFHLLREKITDAYEQAKKSQPDVASSFSQPDFELVGRIDDRRQTALLQAAFDDAKSQAAQLAAVAGVELGPLIKLHKTTGLQPVADDLLVPEKPRQESWWEATTNKPVAVTFRIDVSTIFSIGRGTSNASALPIEQTPAVGRRAVGTRR